jgi:hypothetical protein
MTGARAPQLSLTSSYWQEDGTAERALFTVSIKVKQLVT